MQTELIQQNMFTRTCKRIWTHNRRFQYDVKNGVLPTKCDSKQTVAMFAFKILSDKN